MNSTKNIRKPPNRGYRGKDRVPKRLFDDALEAIEDHNRLLWLKRHNRVGDCYDQLDQAVADMDEGRVDELFRSYFEPNLDLEV